MRKFVPYISYLCAVAIFLVALAASDELKSPAYAIKMGIAFLLLLISVIILIMARIERKK
ncbi:hypothetical protein [Porphyromonas sp.]|uniref:hypothetical protein n=1 Tax=Porphyromonas sp. TaxID=1924944 RepID=UPI0026DABDF2|nr:hypothetical protein [Porphyromonas sp.]MDO4770880.1 hypothetical protein [Porphyromonas sp.]